MRRAVILATFTCILFAAVASVTAARGNSFTSSSQEGDQTESTVPEPRAPRAPLPRLPFPRRPYPKTLKSRTKGR
jgi:hypothetical protein